MKATVLDLILMGLIAAAVLINWKALLFFKTPKKANDQQRKY